MQQQIPLPDDDDIALASHPAAVPLSKMRWLRHYPLWPCFWMLLAMAPWAGMVYAAQRNNGTGIMICLGAALLMLIVNWGYWFRVKGLFEHGDALPGVVIAMSPPRVAVLTDMTMGFGSYPAVKVVKIPLRKIAGRPVQPGLGLAMVTFYSGSKKQPYWSDIKPVPIEAGTADPRMINAVVSEFRQDEWQALQQAVAKLPSQEPGLYRMHGPAGH